MEKPYICVSALQTPEQISDLTEWIEHSDRPVTHDVALGVSIDRGTVEGTQASPRKLPTLKHLAKMGDAVRESARLSIHLECRDRSIDCSDCTSLPELLQKHTYAFVPYAEKAVEAVHGAHVHSFQLNGVVRPDDLAAFKEKTPRIPVIYQLRKELSRLGNDAVGRHLKMCRHWIAHVLIDLSAGTGERASDEEIAELIRTVQSAAPGIQVGLAGGLGPENAEAAYSLHSKNHGPISIDAETKLRHPVTDDVEVDRVKAYLTTTFRAVKN